MGGLCPHRRRSTPARGLEPMANLRTPCFVHRVGPREHDRVGSLERRQGLAQQAAGEEVIAAERVGRVDRHDVEVAAEPTMLESVVENDRPGALFHRPRCSRHAIPVGDVEDSVEHDRELRRLIARRARPGTVAAAHDRRSDSVASHEPCHPGDEWRLAGAAEREIADGNHRHADRVPADDAPVEADVPDRDADAVGDGERREAQPRRRRDGPGAGPVDQPSKAFRIGQERHAWRAASRRRRDGQLDPERPPTIAAGSAPAEFASRVLDVPRRYT